MRAGVPEAEASRRAAVGRRTLARWLGRYRQGSLGEVLRRVPGHGATGQPGRLSPARRQALLEQAKTGAFHTYDQTRAWVAARFGVRYSYQGMYAALHRLGVRPKVPRPRAAKADPAVHAAWKGGAPGPVRPYIAMLIPNHFVKIH